MKNPVVLHFILDGYCPTNKDNFFNNFEDIIPEGYHVGNFHSVATEEDKLRSPDMWTRAYSKTTFAEIKQPGDSARLGTSTKIKRIPAERFLWNKLASKGVKSWLYPFGQYYYTVGSNFLTGSPQDENVSGFLKMYGTKLGYQVDYGVPLYAKSPLSVYYGLHEASWGRELKGDFVDTFKDYRTLWKNPTPEFLEKVPQDIYDYYSDRFSGYLDANRKLFEEEIFPHLRAHLHDFYNGGYIHIGLVEPDTPYHFVPVYPDLVGWIRDYCFEIISKVVDMVNPDILIITGDHGMENVDETWKTARPITVNGQTRLCAVSDWGVAPIYNEHSHEIGGVIAAKDIRHIQDFTDHYHKPEEVFMYNIYDFVEGRFKQDE